MKTMREHVHERAFYLPAPLHEATLLVKLRISEITRAFKIQQQIQHSGIHFYPLLDPPVQEMPGKKTGSLTLTVSMVVEASTSLSCFLPILDGN